MLVLRFYFFFFFFKQKTAYEISSRDWSSDVCSSDLAALVERRVIARELLDKRRDTAGLQIRTAGQRSEERRVGKECVSLCRLWWSAEFFKKKKNDCLPSGISRAHNTEISYGHNR